MSALAEGAAADMAKWESIKQQSPAPGVYEKDGVVISLAVKAGSPRTAGDRTADRAKNAAIEGLMQSLVARIPEESPMKAALMRLGVTMDASFNGRFLLTECTASSCTALFAAPKANVEAEAQKLNAERLAAEGAKRLKANPGAHADFFRAIGLQDLALALDMRALPPGFFNVKAPFVPSAAAISAAAKIGEKRAAVLEDLRKVDPSRDLLFSAVQAVDSPKAFAEKLEAAGIAPIAWTHELPVLREVALVQGFVKLDNSSASAEPATMPFIKQCFAKGQDLKLVTYMLENAAERSPANAEVWEYLTAAYRAAGSKDAAEVCARAWLSTAANPKPALVYLLKRIHDEPAAAQAAALLE